MSLKSRVRPLVDRAAAMSGALALAERRMRRGLTILMYHRVLPAADAAIYPLRSLAMPETIFREQAKWLAEHCDVRPLGEALAALDATTRTGGERERPLVSITFDDGYADNFERAAPMLEERGLRGTFFLTTDLVEGKGPLWFDIIALMTALDARVEEGWGERPSDDRVVRLAETVGLQARLRVLKLLDPETRAHAVSLARERLGHPPAFERFRGMTAANAGELARRGHEIGAHTATHPLLPQCSDETLRDELVQARSLLERWTGARVTSLAYPNGNHDDRVIRAAADAGYSCACTTAPGVNARGVDRMRLHRLDMTPARLVTADGQHDELGFRAELSLVRQALRRKDAADTASLGPAVDPPEVDR